jgi:hypothetical protein
MAIGRLFTTLRVGSILTMLAVAVPAFAQDPAQTAPPDSHQMPGGDGEYPKLRLAGFGDIDFARQEHTEGPRNFSLGQFVLHLTSQMSSRVTFLGEISFSARTDAGTGTPPAPGYNVEIERMIVRFDRSDRLRVSVGRYHTPINYWNTQFHHGQWLQTTISRPEMIQFGGKFLPVHFVGALVEGVVPAGGLNIGYTGGVGNGRGNIISRGGDAGDNNTDLSYLGGLTTKPDALFGLEAGVSFLADTIGATGGTKIPEQIVAAHVAYSKETPEFIAEFASVRHDIPGTGPLWSHAYYLQGAYRFGFDNRKWKGYYRFEHIGIPPGDIAFATVPLLDGSTLGVRYDASAYAAIKVEYRNWTRGAGSVRNSGGFFQLSFTF